MMITQDEKAAIAAQFAPKVAGHTPGPWEIDKQDIFGKSESGKRMFVCTWSTKKANASLIAAAPELLEAAKAWLEYDSDDSANGVDMMFRYSEAMKLTRAAIAKAEARK